ncbi:MAG TPA: hypothetical protein VFE63_18290 [Roseiarcus sp.]|nr:hypothetical protein [Roseiarcus sp.]
MSVALAVLGASGAAGAAPLVSAALERRGQDVDSPLTPDVAPPSAETTDAAPGPFQGVPLASLTATRERPLFSATRRPPPAAPSAEPPPPPKPVAVAPVKPVVAETPPLALVGTITGGETPVAILFNQATRSVSQVREGDEELGWRITAVSARSAVAEKDGNVVTLDLPRPSDSAEPPPAADTGQ